MECHQAGTTEIVIPVSSNDIVLVKLIQAKQPEVAGREENRAQRKEVITN